MSDSKQHILFLQSILQCSQMQQELIYEVDQLINPNLKKNKVVLDLLRRIGNLSTRNVCYVKEKIENLKLEEISSGKTNEIKFITKEMIENSLYVDEFPKQKEEE